MKALLQDWSAKECGPVFSTRREESDGSVSYEALFDVSLRFTVIGNDAHDFIEYIKALKAGATITGIGVSRAGAKCLDRKYVFE